MNLAVHHMMRRYIVNLPDCCTRSGFTYVFHSGDFVKIGRSINPANRFSDIESCNPLPLSVVGLSRGDCEQALHYMFRDYHMHHEWFSSDCLTQILPMLMKSSCMTCIVKGTEHRNMATRPSTVRQPGTPPSRSFE